MKNSRIAKRAGFGVLRGATNPRISVRDQAPQSGVIQYDLWLDISSSPAVLKWADISIVDGERVITWTE